MSNYYLILIWVAFFAVLQSFVRMKRTEVVCGKKEYRMKPEWAFVLFLPLIIWSMDRGNIGDTYAYIEMYKDIPRGIANIASYMSTVTKDEGFYFLSVVIKCIIGEKEKIYLLVIALIQVFLLIRVYRKYSYHYAMTFFLFIASTDYISWMFNGIRQFVAVTITFACFEFILEKQYVKAIIGILIASLFHGSALIVIPFIFICQGRAWNRKTMLFIMAVLVAVIYINQFTNILDTMLADTQYENVVSDWEMWEDEGTNVLRVLVYSVPALLSFVGLKYIRRADNPIINICTNMSIVAAGIYVISMFTSGIFIGRLPIYFSLYSYILLPWEIENMFESKSAKMVYLLMIIGYVGFYLVGISGI